MTHVPATRIAYDPSGRLQTGRRLARQFLLERADLPVEAAVEHLVGLQAQTPHTWYTGLWTRLGTSTPATPAPCSPTGGWCAWPCALDDPPGDRRDAVSLRPLLDQVVRKPLSGVHRRGVDGIDLAELVDAGRALVDAEPLTFSELGTRLARRWPDRDPATLALAVRALLPLVQVPPRGVWGRSGRALHTSLAAWLPRPARTPATARDLVLRYLGAFGPASVRDMQNWSGLSRLQEIVDELRPQLMTFRDEAGRELFDRARGAPPRPGHARPRSASSTTSTTSCSATTTAAAW